MLSLIAVILVARINAQDDHAKWLREERVRSAIQLKLAVSQVRVQFSRPGDGRRLDGGQPARAFDFAEVNAAMAHMDLVGSTGTVALVTELRGQLREFVRESTENRPGWRARREALDTTVDSIVETVRKDVVS
ncbi:hypothetical protein [Streptomyces sp. NBC_00391]|uniref:hypothetical protein n=1 Tax=Streptomyces sp. NBC_00391 TaxID=2903647 RepID=UPI002E1B7568